MRRPVASAWIVPDTAALPNTTIMTAFDPVRFSVTPAAIVRPRKASTSMLGPPICVRVLAEGRACVQVAPVQCEPSYVTVPAHVRSTAPTGASAASWDIVRLLGV